MKVLGIIAEYNPFHSGHKYHIQMSKEITSSDFVICVMSGNFTEQGNIAIYDKFKRANIAKEYGADLVIELPVIYANSSASFFAFGAINLLNKLNIVDSICFGTETEDINTLINISNKIVTNESNIWKDIKENLKVGTSFANARSLAMNKYLDAFEIEQINKPNNILGIEYLNNLKKLNSNIKPYNIERFSSNFNEKLLNNGDYTSATSIRNYIYTKNNDINNISKYLPQESFNVIKNITPTSNDMLFNIIKYILVNESKDNLSNINEVTEGLENKLIECISISNTYDEFVQNVKSKRYQLSKIKRMLINILLTISKDDFSFAVENKITYAHILSCNANGKKLLSKISTNSDISIITSINDKVISKLDDNISKYLNIDILASNIYSIINNEAINKDYTNKL